MNDRMHPQDLRAMIAATLTGQLALAVGDMTDQDVTRGIQGADALLAELESTEKPAHQGPFGEVVPRDRVDAIVRRAEGAEAERDALRSRLGMADDMLRGINDQNDRLEALNRELNASRNDWKACAERAQASLAAIEAAASAAVLAYGAHAHAQLRELFNESRAGATLKALEAMSKLDITLQAAPAAPQGEVQP